MYSKLLLLNKKIITIFIYKIVSFKPLNNNNS